MFRILFAFISLISLTTLLACADRTLAEIPLRQVSEERQVFDISENRDIDILFVVDNSRSMKKEQESLGEKFSALINAFNTHPDGLPSVHIGVISTDIGVGSNGGVCSSNGDNGSFQGQRSCQTLNGPFLKSIVDEGGIRTNNFSGDLSETFQCMATSVGIKGCGFEQPLESMRRALSSSEAQEFLRPHAYLAVIFVTDEDDCSAKDTAIFDGTPQDLSSILGPPRSFRCFEFGAECDEKTREEGVKTNCTPRINSPYLFAVEEYIDFLYQLKASPAQILVASIAGEIEPVRVEKIFDTDLGLDVMALAYSCTESGAEAIPPIRLNAFVNGFTPDHSQTTSICAEDLSDALQDIGLLIQKSLTPCLESELEDIDPDTEGLQVDCVVSLRSPNQDEQVLEECDNISDPESSSHFPCYTLLPDTVQCSAHPSMLSPKVHYAQGTTILPGTEAQASCMVKS